MHHGVLMESELPYRSAFAFLQQKVAAGAYAEKDDNEDDEDDLARR